jgi:hypothetical protein
MVREMGSMVAGETDSSLPIRLSHPITSPKTLTGASGERNISPAAGPSGYLLTEGILAWPRCAAHSLKSQGRRTLEPYHSPHRGPDSHMPGLNGRQNPTSLGQIILSGADPLRLCPTKHSSCRSILHIY